MTGQDALRQDGRGRLGFALGVVAVLALAALPFALGPERRAMLTQEGGPVELLSALGYVACAALMLRLRRRVAVAPFLVVLAAMALRELDMDKRPFTEGLLKSRQYLGDAVGPAEKAVSLAILLAILAAAATLVLRHGGAFLSGLRRGSGPALCVAAALVLVVVSKSADGLARKLEPWGIALSEARSASATSLEESLELGIPLMISLAILSIPARARDQAPADRRQRSRSP